ncbi:hypothetical protein SO802_030286 [Lithocarpus litseifolius]|uniref:Uncharacterized protein n=1 Tax=Lithocarpus litseifolius TaxID=425828 RepID=A0AAW2BMN9_9ROSI
MLIEGVPVMYVELDDESLVLIFRGGALVVVNCGRFQFILKRLEKWLTGSLSCAQDLWLFSVNRPDPCTTLPLVRLISISILARIRAQIEKNKERGSSSHQEAPGFGGANVDLDAEIDRMVEEGAPPFDMTDIQAKFEELLIQIASSFSHMDSLFVDMFTDLTVLTQGLIGLSSFYMFCPPPSPPTEE